MSLSIPVSWGELLDKMTILTIKQERIENTDKRANIEKELRLLTIICDQNMTPHEDLAALVDQLKRVNELLWDVEDDIRACERAGEFGERFIALARRVYQTNDRRAELKYQINQLMGSELVEEKSYEDY